MSSILFGTEAARAAMNFGLGVVLSVAILGVLIWVVHKVICQCATREKCFMSIIEKQIADNTKAVQRLSDSIARLVDRIDTSISITREAHKYQREEHKEMSAILLRMNGRSEVNG